MDRQMLERCLEQAQSQVTLDRQHIERHVQFIVELERDGHESRSAKQFLATLAEMQTMHEQERDRIAA